MYAVIKSGGKQYRVQAGDLIRVEKQAGNKGDKLEFNEVILVSKDDSIVADQEQLAQVKVVGQVVEQDRAKKVIIYKYKRRKNYRRKLGHRQYLTSVVVKGIEGI